MTERSEISTIEADDRAQFTEKAAEILSNVGDLSPESMRCIMVCAVDNEGKIQVGVLGTDMDIAKMFNTMITVAHNGVLQANAPSNPNDETPH